VSLSEQIINRTSAQLGYTVPFTSVYAGKYGTEDKSKTDTTKTKHNSDKANNTKHSKTKLASGSVASYYTQPGNDVGLFYNPPRAHTGLHSR